jgi:spore germination cell wall hydrolase CwlJ-like protein
MTDIAELKNRAAFGLMALTLWREARGESAECVTGVAFCILNRVLRKSWWGNSIYSVITKKWQFSSLTDPRDKQLALYPSEGSLDWQRCLMIADKVINREIENPVPGADSYFDISIGDPKWTKDARFVKQIGRIKFYDVDHDYEKEE